jgi:hypothetical protein
MSEYMRSDNVLKSKSNTKVPQRGRVIENRDPLFLGRVKVSIQSMEEDFSADSSDWVFPVVASKPGKNPLSFSFPEVPEIGSEVEISHTYDDKSIPRASVPVSSKINITPDVFCEDYPDSFGEIDRVSMSFVNKKKPEVTKFFDKASNLFQIDADGNLLMNIPKDLVISIDGNLLFKVTGDYGIKVEGNHGTDVGGSREAKVGGDEGVVAAGFISSQGSKVTHNSGTEVGIVSGIMSKVSDGANKVKDVVDKFKKLFAKAKNADSAGRGRIGRE